MHQSKKSEAFHFTLEQLIKDCMSDIVVKEHIRKGTIRLYGANGYWNAFEESAYQISQFSPKHDVLIFHHKEIPFPVIMVSVKDEVMDMLDKKLVAHYKEPGYREYTGTEMTEEQYSGWHRAAILGEI